MHEILNFASGSPRVASMCEQLQRKGVTVYLREIVGGALSFYSAACIAKMGGVHIFVSEDRDAAAYMLNDMYALLGEQNVYFFPSAYKNSIVYRKEEAENVVMRTAAISALRENREMVVICTYPEALAEMVISEKTLRSDSIRLKVGDTIKVSELQQQVEQMGFEQVDFVYEPGQFSLRGGIFDVFSYADSKPYRIDFFDDDIDSIRKFELSNQLSSERLEQIDIISNINSSEAERVSLAGFAQEGTFWFYDADYALRKVDDLRRKALQESSEPEVTARGLTSRKALLDDMDGKRVFSQHNNLPERPACQTISFTCSPQPKFNKNFQMLADNIADHIEHGYKTFLLTENRAQMERLSNIFYQLNHQQLSLQMMRITLHNGFVDDSLKLCFYTDHEIFVRYQRYHINGEIKHDEQMTIQELNALKVGDFVVHIDHGVGRFGGLVKISDNGKSKEAIKLIYKDGDVLFVDVHSLHKISRYRSGEGDPPKIYKLGGSAWQKLKNSTKKAIKDISRQLIALYAKRKASKGFAFSADSYLQHELEASFEYEDTPDQLLATKAVKADMESSRPMDRLVCGDVGFGKTEVAIRAAFKAATDGKQVAVLVPTTILALQHYRSFSERLKDFPVTIEYLNRTKSAKETKRILEDLKSGKVDIIIGTHKILGKNVEFKDLGLLVIDEEQRFGVAAKEKLTQLSVSVDTLTLTATPIPRTLQFSLMGSRDLSVISTPPPNRQPIVTESHVFSEELIRDAVNAELSRNGQVYFIHNNVSELQEFQGLIQRLCPEAKVAAAHGRMKPEELEKLIMDFIYGDFDVLVATSIIESGVDIPNVNTILVNNADHFGLSNLHQLRGRVGRSDRKAFCYLLSRSDELLTSDARRRLKAIEEFSDLGSGFNIAMQDLDIRGAGNLLGAEQSGFVSDMGFETYQKILNEAIAELRNEGLDVAGLTKDEQQTVSQGAYVDDTTIELGVEASLPETYVRQQAERLRLYRELDSIKEEGALLEFESKLVDRFGQLPQPARELLDVVRLRWEAMRLGMEKVKVKNGLMITFFVADSSSQFYKSDVFMQMLQKVMQAPDRFVVKQKELKLQMTVRNVNGVKEAVEVLKTL